VLRQGTYRTVDPGETAARVLAHRAALGITRVANVTGLDRIGVPVVAVYRPNARSLSVSQGKGLTLAAARASGLMEAVELHHAEHVARPLLRASHAALRRTHPVIDVARLPRPRGSRFRADRAIRWIEGRTVRTGEPVWLPYEMVHTDGRLQEARTAIGFVAGGNGLAAGNTRVEALIHGLCEVVERDAATLWFQGPQAGIDESWIALDTVEDPACREVLARYRAAGITAGVWETTTDTGIPAFLCQIAELGPGRARPVSGAHGMGCHPDPAVALLRALTEAAQCRLTWIAGARDDARPEDYDASPEALAWERQMLVGRRPGRPFPGAAGFAGRTLEHDLHWLLDRLEAVGVPEPVWVDLGRPEIGIPVVHVVVAGLEPRGFGDALEDYRPGPRARAARRRHP
jgi:ribosomal protein S12 methylthiotransferase accessory factor